MPKSQFRKTRRPLVVLLTIAVAGGWWTTLAAQDVLSSDDNVLLHGSALPWGARGSGGVQLVRLYGDPQVTGQPFTYRLRLPDGFEMGPHTHPVGEHMTVMSGRFFVGLGRSMDRGAAEGYGPGSYVVVAANEPAYMWTEGETVVQVHGVGPLTTTMVEAREPDDRP